MTRLRLVLGFLVALTLAPSAFAQNANQAQLRVIVVDQTGAGIPAATVTVTPSAGQPLVVTADERGLVTVPALAPGAVTLHVEFPGFEAFDQPVTLRRGQNNQTVTLTIAGFQEEVVVSDASSTNDARGNSLTTTLEQATSRSCPTIPTNSRSCCSR